MSRLCSRPHAHGGDAVREAGGGHAVPQLQRQHRRGRRVRLHVRAQRNVESLLERLETVVPKGARRATQRGRRVCRDYAKVHVRAPLDGAGVLEALPLRQERDVLRVLVLPAEHFFFCNDYTF
jgi:hypothetical protein